MRFKVGSVEPVRTREFVIGFSFVTLRGRPSSPPRVYSDLSGTRLGA